jgi:hypothetical protein
MEPTAWARLRGTPTTKGAGTRHDVPNERQEPLVAGGVVDLRVPGQWYARPSAAPEHQRRLVGQTPGKVVLLPEKVYELYAAKEVTDQELSDLAQIRGFAGLEYLNLEECERVTKAGLAHLRASPPCKNST